MEGAVGCGLVAWAILGKKSRDLLCLRCCKTEEVNKDKEKDKLERGIPSHGRVYASVEVLLISESRGYLPCRGWNVELLEFISGLNSDQCLSTLKFAHSLIPVCDAYFGMGVIEATQSN